MENQTQCELWSEATDRLLEDWLNSTTSRRDPDFSERVVRGEAIAAKKELGISQKNFMVLSALPAQELAERADERYFDTEGDHPMSIWTRDEQTDRTIRYFSYRAEAVKDLVIFFVFVGTIAGCLLGMYGYSRISEKKLKRLSEEYGTRANDGDTSEAVTTDGGTSEGVALEEETPTHDLEVDQEELTPA